MYICMIYIYVYYVYLCNIYIDVLYMYKDVLYIYIYMLVEITRHYVTSIILEPAAPAT